MIHAIAIDLGGVYFSEGKSIAVDRLENEYGYDRNIIAQFFKCPKSLDLRKGLISDEEFWTWAKTELPQGYDAGHIRKMWYDSYTPDQDIVELVQELKDAYKLVVFSENIQSRVEYLDTKYDFREYFAGEVYSYEKHALKYYALQENKEFYMSLLKDAGCQPGELVAIDDGENAVAMLKTLDVKALLYKQGKIGKLKEELKQLGVVA